MKARRDRLTVRGLDVGQERRLEPFGETLAGRPSGALGEREEPVKGDRRHCGRASISEQAGEVFGAFGEPAIFRGQGGDELCRSAQPLATEAFGGIGGRAIGRASCGDRVFQYVLFLVYAVALKKKIRTNLNN